jgi:DNA-binding XRE family transcriptional regulator
MSAPLDPSKPGTVLLQSMTLAENSGLARSREELEELIELATALAAADETMRRALINARNAAGMTQKDVAELLGIKQSSIAAFERHDNDPKLSTIRRYALAVGARVDHRVCTADVSVETDGWSTVSTPPLPTREQVKAALEPGWARDSITAMVDAVLALLRGESR